jgi:hypothetical protein
MLEITIQPWDKCRIIKATAGINSIIHNVISRHAQHEVCKHREDWQLEERKTYIKKHTLQRERNN